MSRTRTELGAPPAPELFLRKASLAKTAGLRAKYAQLGLDYAGPIDPTTRAMLLRQLYLVALSRRRFSEARALAHEMIALEVLSDAAHQDAARACLGQKDVDGAVRHLRLASRFGPASRRALHWSMLGALLYLNGRALEALNPLRLAARWSTTDKAICRGQLLLAELEAKLPNANPEELRDELAEVREDIEVSQHRRGYADFILGEICLMLGDEASARTYLEDFVARIASGRVALQISLQSELRRARRDLGRLRRKRAE